MLLANIYNIYNIYIKQRLVFYKYLIYENIIRN